MSFYNNSKAFISSFGSDQMPELLSVCLAQGVVGQMPRVMHHHDDRIEILLVISGSAQYSIDGVTCLAQAGDILVYNQGAIHDEMANPASDMVVFSLAVGNLQLLDREANQLVTPGFKPVFASGPAFSKLKHLFELIYAATAANDFRQAEFANYLLRALLIAVDNQMLEQSDRLGEDKQALGGEIKAYLDQHFLEEITLSQVAQFMHVNQYYLAHCFKEYSGYSPLQYIIRRRIGEAQTLLLNTEFSVTQIASRVGYNNLNHFHSAFVKVVGMAPGKYRRSWTAES
ncbi:MAG: AraC family transcriptional regulator [Clostridia bacterium]|nr:AraC family transcriptional regulator [Clostridia bacterium]